MRPVRQRRGVGRRRRRRRPRPARHPARRPGAAVRQRRRGPLRRRGRRPGRRSRRGERGRVRRLRQRRRRRPRARRRRVRRAPAQRRRPAFTDVSAAAGIGDDDRRGSAPRGATSTPMATSTSTSPTTCSCTGEWSTEEDIIANVAYYPDTLYRNDGDGTFTDVTDVPRERPDDRDDGSTEGAGFAATWFDYNGDNRLDLYLANDFVGVSPDHNRLWRNDGPAAAAAGGSPTCRCESGTAFWMNTMGIAVGDVERDGDLDMALSNITANKLRAQRRRRVRRGPGGRDRPPTAAGWHRVDHVGRRLPRPQPRRVGGPLLRGRQLPARRPRGRSAAQRAVRQRRRRRTVPRRQRGDRRRRSPATRRVSPSPTTTATATSTSSSSTRAERRACCATSRLADSNHWLAGRHRRHGLQPRRLRRPRRRRRRRRRDDAAGVVWLDQRRVGQPDDGPLRSRPGGRRGRARGRLAHRASASGSPTSPSTASSSSRRLAADGPRGDAPSVHGTTRSSVVAPPCSRCATSPSATDRCRRTTTSRSTSTPGRSMPSSARTARASRRSSASPPAPSSPTPGVSRSTAAR